MPRLVALALAIGIALSACRGESGGAGAPTGPPESPSASPSAGVTPSPTRSPANPTSSPPGRARCTLVLGMSVTANWFLDGGFESLPGVDNASWELIWESGHDVILYADPNSLPYSASPLSSCGTDPDRALFQIAARDWQFPDAVVAELRASIENIRAAWPSVEVVELIPIVGGPGGEPCDDATHPDKGVLASMMYPVMTAAIDEVIDGSGVVAGPDLELTDCALFRDGTGHLTPSGSREVASALATYYGS